MCNIIESLGGIAYKRYRLYENLQLSAGRRA